MKVPLSIFYRDGVPVRVDWKNLDDVIAYAQRLGPGMSVVHVPERDNFNIMHTSREHEKPNVVVWFRT
jgi:hypothetical protein